MEIQRQLGFSFSLKKTILYKKMKGNTFLFLNKTGIVIKKWLIAAGPLEGDNSY